MEVQSAIGKNTSWCYASPQVQNLGLNYNIGAVKATVYQGVTTCHVRSLILQSPLNKDSDNSSTTNTTTSRSPTSTKSRTPKKTASAKPTSAAQASGASPVASRSSITAAAAASPTQTGAANRLSPNSWLLGVVLFFVA